MTKDKFKQHLIDMVVENGIPLTLFSSKGFQGLSGKLAEKLGVSLERHEIRKSCGENIFYRKLVSRCVVSRFMAEVDKALWFILSVPHFNSVSKALNRK